MRARNWIAIAGLALLLAACGRQSEPAAPAKPEATATPAAVPSPAPTEAEEPACPEWNPPRDGKDHGQLLKKPLRIPRAWRSIASATRTVMTVEGLDGQPICVRLAWVEEASGFRLSPDKRYFSFDTRGLETHGHILVDRAASGANAWIDTGATPHFSADRRYLAAAQIDTSQDADGTLQAIKVWETGANGFTRRARITNIPEGMAEWQVDGWASKRCVNLAAAKIQKVELADGADPVKALREARAKILNQYFRLVPRGGGWRLEQGVCGGSMPVRHTG